MRNLRRIKQIANVLFSNQLGYIVDRLNLSGTLSFKNKLRLPEKPKQSVPERLRSAMEDLGGTFVKLGQLLSLRYDILPKEYCDEFSKLQEGVRPFSFAQVKQIIEKELGKPLKDVFKEFDQQPVAAASVGQVHKAVLKDGKVVAVKVQRPDIEQIFEADIDLLFNLARIAEKRIPETRDYNPVGIIQEFERYTKKELDYLAEAKNIDIFYDNFKDDKTIVIPKVYWEYTTSKVLTMKFINGHKISDIKKFSTLKADKHKIVKHVVDSFIKQVLEYGVFHADPHPGNIFIVEDSIVAMLDFGIVGKLSPELKDKIEDLLVGLNTKDVDLLAETTMSIGILDSDTDMKQFKNDLVDRFSDYYGASLNQVNMMSFFSDSLAIARKYKMKFPTAYVLLVKAMLTTSGFIQLLDPEFNFFEETRPTIEKIIAERSRPGYVVNSMKRNLRNFKYFVTDFPRDVNSLMQTLKKGALINVDIDNRDIKKLTHELDTSSNRLTLGMVLLALIVASALFTNAKLEPRIYGMPLAAIISLAASVFVAICLTISILREQKGGEEYK